MASNFQSSFIPTIPKDPTSKEVFKKGKTGILGMLVIILFVASIVLSVGLYVYKYILQNDITALQSELAEAEGNIDKETINEMAKFSGKLDVVRTIITKHRVVSNFLDILAKNTVSSVYFTDFHYGELMPNELSINMEGRAVNYASLALQSDIFSKNESFKFVDFSNLDLVEGGSVSFKVTVIVDPRVSIFNIPAKGADQTTTVSTTTIEDISTELDQLEDMDLDIPDL